MSRLEKNDELLTEIGAAIAKRRQELRLSQDVVAAKSGVHRTYLSDVERGLRNVSVLTLQRIAEALDVHLGALLIGYQGIARQPKRREVK